MRRYILIFLVLSGFFAVILLLQLAQIKVPNQFRVAIGTGQNVYLISKSFKMRKIFSLKDFKPEEDLNYIKLSSFLNPDTLFLYVIGKKEKQSYFLKVNIHSSRLSRKNSPIFFRKLKLKKASGIIVGIEDGTDNIFLLDQYYRIKKSFRVGDYNKSLKSVVSPKGSFSVPPAMPAEEGLIFRPIDVDVDERNNIIISGFGSVQIIEISDKGDFISAIDLMEEVDDKYAKKYDYLSIEQLKSIGRDRLCILAHFFTRWDAGPQEKMLAIYDNVHNKFDFTFNSEDIRYLDIYTKPTGVLDLFRAQRYIDPYYFNVRHDYLLIANLQHGGSGSSTVVGIDFKKKLVFQFPENYFQDLIFKDIGFINYIDLL
ncbi:MAG: hypothetical protein J7K33_06140 [Candidatus Marinimicrobia bacterium]|nr:hypothetical protein [Candidatus Neomarinimicrobiota bacterium]